MLAFSIWPLVAAGAAAVAIGYGWYHPRAFGPLWMRLSGMTPEMAERASKHRHLYALAGFATTFIVAYVVRTLLAATTIVDIGSAVRLALYLFAGLVAPILLGSVLWEHRPLRLYLINAGYWLVVLVVMAIIVSV